MEELEKALKEGVAVTARVMWLPRRRVEERRRTYEDKEKVRGRVIRCTPLRGGDGRVGVWMVVLVPERDGGGGGNEVVGSQQKRRCETRSNISVMYKVAKTSDGDGHKHQNDWREEEEERGRGLNMV